MTVTGAGSRWTNAGAILVGGLGTGTLTIENGGRPRTAEQYRGLDRVVCRLDRHGYGDRPRLQLEQRSIRRAQYRQFWRRNPHDRERGTVIDNIPLVTNIGNGAGSLVTVTVTGAGSLWTDIAG